MARSKPPEIDYASLLEESPVNTQEKAVEIQVAKDFTKIPEPQVSLASTTDTVKELRQRLAKELYRIELDLIGGGRIGGKPCDCLGRGKHSLGLEATAEELIPMDKKPVYNEILTWLKKHEEDFKPENIEKHPPEYYRNLSPEARKFRKEVISI